MNCSPAILIVLAAFTGLIPTPAGTGVDPPRASVEPPLVQSGTQDYEVTLKGCKGPVDESLRALIMDAIRRQYGTTLGDEIDAETTPGTGSIGNV